MSDIEGSPQHHQDEDMHHAETANAHKSGEDADIVEEWFSPKLVSEEGAILSKSWSQRREMSPVRSLAEMRRSREAKEAFGRRQRTGSKRKHEAEHTKRKDDISERVKDKASTMCTICQKGHKEASCPNAQYMFKSFGAWRQFSEREKLCLRCVRVQGQGQGRCRGDCCIYTTKAGRMVDVTCKVCVHDDKAKGEEAGLHRRFCHCVFGKKTRKRKRTTYMQNLLNIHYREQEAKKNNLG